MTQTYERVLITNIWDTKEKGLSQIPVFTEEEYMKQLKIQDKSHGGLCELVGLKEYQVKPYFDLDPKGEFDYAIFDEFEKDINRIYYDLVAKEGTINVGEREPREEEWRGKQIIKHSRRYYLNAKISYFNIPIVFKELFEKYKDIVDTSVYTINRRLFTPLSERKRNLIVPQLKVIKGSLFGCCATYIEEDFADLDLKIVQVKPEIKKVIQVEEGTEIYTDKDKSFIFNKLKEHVAVLLPHRSSGFDSWFKMICCLNSISEKHQISRRNKIELLHKFSQLASDYNEDKVDEWIDKHLDNLKSGYAWNYLIQSIKEDNEDYYRKNFSQTYSSVKKEFEKNCFKCMKPLGFIVLNTDINDYDSEVLTVLKKKELLDAEENKYYVKCEEDKKGDKKWVKTPFIKDWLKDENIKTYEKLIFTPEHLNVEASKKYYNLFNGFKAELLPVFKNYERIQPVLDHMKIVLCNNNEEHYNWLLQYYANILQNPTKKTDTIIMYKGIQGCGKSIFVDNFANNIIGQNYSVSTANPERQLLGNFNGLLINKVFAV